MEQQNFSYDAFINLGSIPPDLNEKCEVDSVTVLTPMVVKYNKNQEAKVFVDFLNGLIYDQRFNLVKNNSFSAAVKASLMMSKVDVFDCDIPEIITELPLGGNNGEIES